MMAYGEDLIYTPYSMWQSVMKTRQVAGNVTTPRGRGKSHTSCTAIMPDVLANAKI